MIARIRPFLAAIPWPPVVVFLALGVAHAIASPVGEPFKNNDETRQVMTGVFFRDALFDLPTFLADPKGYAVRYYAQYPALGLLIWPPLFHLMEGLAMAVFGTSYLTARLLVYLYAVVGGVYAYRLFARTHGHRVAAVALSLLGFAPGVFDLCGYVLLEIPTLALVLASVFYFERHLDGERPRDAMLACGLAALAALTRFDGVVLLPYFLFRLAGTRRFGLLLRKPVLLGAVLALGLTAPYYLFTWAVYGGGIRGAAVAGTDPRSTTFLDPRSVYLYPSFLLDQVRWPGVIAAAAGVAVTLARGRANAGPYFALMAATYVTFVPLAEAAVRHAVYWVPAVALFAAVALRAVWDRFGPWAGRAAAAGLVGYMAHAGMTWSGWYLRGNEAAARYVAAHASGDRPVLVEGILNGGFTYYVRREDPARRLWVLRADKVFYAVLSDPHGGYREYATTDAEVLALLHRYDPEFVVVEQPQLLFNMPAANLLRAVLAAHPERFKLEETIPFDSNHHVFRRGWLEVYRKLDRNPHPTPAVELPVLGLGKTVGAGR